ncbi:MAG: UPF0158 family protein [Oscillospiraceae bacterium]|nr:UPF0158 family protein [Oscillospiraceae bacterium]
MKIKLQQVIDAIEEADDNWTGFYDSQTGETVWLGDRDFDDADDAYEETEELIETSVNRFYRFPTKFDIHEYSIMEDFMDDLPAGVIRNELMNAIHGRGAFRRFKDGIYYHGIEQQWYDYQAEAYKRIAVRWCRDEGLEYEE